MFDGISETLGVSSSPKHLSAEEAAAKSAEGRAETSTKGHKQKVAKDESSMISWLSDVSNITYGGQRSVYTGTTIANMAMRHKKFQQQLADLQRMAEAKRLRQERRAEQKRRREAREVRKADPNYEWDGSEDEDEDEHEDESEDEDEDESQDEGRGSGGAGRDGEDIADGGRGGRAGAAEDAEAKMISEYMTTQATDFRDLVLANGGFQIKVGQMIAMQKELLPTEVTTILQTCCEEAPSMPFDELEDGLVRQLGRPLDEVFDHIVKEPLASASIAQVHRATLKGTVLPRTPKSQADNKKGRGKGKDVGKEADDAMSGGYRSYKRKGKERQTDEGGRGKEVIIKVQHPGVADMMKADVAFLPYLMSLISMIEPEHEMGAFGVLVEDMLAQELDFRVEGHNRERLSAVIERSGRSARSRYCDIVFPEVYWDYAAEGVIVQEFASNSVSLANKAEVNGSGVSFLLAIGELAEVFAETAFVHGYVHNDLHTGNVLVRPQAQKQTLLNNPTTRRYALRAPIVLSTSLYLALLWAALFFGNAVWGLLVAFVFNSYHIRSVYDDLVLLGFGPWLDWGFWSGRWSVGTLVGVLGGAFVLYRSNSGWLAEFKRTLRAPAINVASRALSKHKELVMALEGGVASFTRARFDLILIDHGFHTHIDENFRRAWCKVWAAVGLCDEDALREAGAMLGLEGEEYRFLPIFCCLLPYPGWVSNTFPGPARAQEMFQHPVYGGKAARRVSPKLPRTFALIQRVNRQVFAMFQMQYGLIPKMRYEFMYLMTKYALLGLEFEGHHGLPDPSNLHTADKAWIEKKMPEVEARMAKEFTWKMPSVYTQIPTGGIIRAAMRKGAAKLNDQVAEADVEAQKAEGQGAAEVRA